MTSRIPFHELRISTDPDWFVVDLKTVEDCDEAIIHLTRDIAHIDSQIVDEAAEEAATGVVTDADWLAKAKSARAVKVAIRGIVQRVQGELGRATKRAYGESRDRKLLGLLKAAAPDAFAAAVSQMGGE